VRPDLPADVVKAFAQAGIKVRSTRRWEIESIDHPAVKPLVEYKKLYRIWVAHGWSWLQDWVRDGRFRPEFLAGGTVTGRWVTNGGGGLQIPKVIRRAVVADPGWRLVVADADQMEPRVLAAISRDPGLMEVAGRESDLYQSVSDRAFSGDRAQAKLAVQQIVYTAQGTLQKRVPVVFYVGDDTSEPSSVLGLDAAGGFVAAPDVNVLALVNITEPAQDSTVADTFTASGVANSFEATVPWEIRDQDGKKVLDGFATADGWGDKLYPWESTVDASSLPPGTYTFVALTDDPSGGEGGGPTEDSKTFSLS
jgi:hypothetical protein